MTLRRQVAETIGYWVEPRGAYYFRLHDPDGNVVRGSEICESEQEAWLYTPPLDSWEGVGLVIKWLMQDPSNAQTISHLLCARTENFPKALCEFVLEVSK